MKLLGCFSLAGLLLFSTAINAEVAINLSKCGSLDTETFKTIAKTAMSRRHWQVEEESANSIIGGLKDYKAEITMENPTKIVIRFLPGFAHRKENWLWNLRKDFLDELTR